MDTASFLGNALLLTALSASLCIVLLSGAPTKRKKYARPLMFVSAAAITCAGGLLYWLIFTDRFDIAYVWSYSEKALPAMYKFAAFWAGQQGSFLLWLWIHALAGYVLTLPGKMNEPAQNAHALLTVLLASMTLANSPFLPTEGVYTDGAGMNPLLQDPWMAVHPPLIFIGYALLAVPLCHSVGALWERGEQNNWLASARRWGLVAFAFLGTGIFIGGFWAYKVLGWGGYWGWDPVENSSLVPWLVAAAFLHLLRVSRIRGAALVLAHLSALFAFSLVLYGTFLTRSGLLGDFSVHSFSGTSIGLLLAVINGGVLLAGLALLTNRAADLPQGEFYETHDSREFWTLAGVLALAFIAAVVFVGMSFPLLTQLADAPSAVDVGFYTRTTAPLAVFMLATMTLAALYRWGENTADKGLFLRLLGSAAFGLAFSILTGVRGMMPLLIAALSTATVAASVLAWREGRFGNGGMIAHIGVALSLFAMVLSEAGGEPLTAEIQPDETVSFAGRHEIVYRGMEFDADGSEKRYVFSVDGKETRAITKLRNSGEDAAREPAIARFMTGDIYIAPSPQKDTSRKELLLKRGKAVMDETYAYMFDGAENTTVENGTQLVTATVSVTDGERVETAAPFITIKDGKPAARPVPVFDGKIRLRLTGVSEDYRKIRLEVLPSEEEMARQSVAFSASLKPYIWLLWLGAVLVTAGCFAAARER